MFKTTKMLPDDLHDIRQSIPVLDALGAPAYPDAGAYEPGKLSDDPANLKADETHLSLEIGGQQLSIMDKKYPHAMYDLMLFSTGESKLPGTVDHSAEFLREVAATVGVFTDFARERGLDPAVAWSYDPSTEDRASIQGEKRFHMHYIGRTAPEHTELQIAQSTLGDLTPERQRRFVDEASVVASVLATDLFSSVPLNTLEHVPPTPDRPSSYAAIQFRLKNGWESAHDPQLMADMGRIHTTLSNTYTHIANSVLIPPEHTGPWTRSSLRPDASQQAHTTELPLSDNSRSVLAHYLDTLRPHHVPSPQRAQKNYPDLANAVFPLADFACSFSVASQHGQPHLSVRTALFSDLGGAGLQMWDGVVLKTRKGTSTLTQAGIAERHNFQQGFVHALHESQKQRGHTPHLPQNIIPHRGLVPPAINRPVENGPSGSPRL